ncbi:ATP-binding protein [Allosphingosinicella deserti]|uniref:ATP-binding protein n=1 Tax=Allosphingosinicella deserti TaxID=2116704 RepID=UPI0011B26460|nr:ATP-binding protein [Sphingomonas deserti]
MAAAEPLFRLTVDDTGPGISTELLPRLFEGGITTNKVGMGVGLCISRTIIENHGGRLWGEIRAIGARLGFEFPLRGATQRVRATAAVSRCCRAYREASGAAGLQRPDSERSSGVAHPSHKARSPVPLRVTEVR